jgi:hypothetical protein
LIPSYPCALQIENIPQIQTFKTSPETPSKGEKKKQGTRTKVQATIKRRERARKSEKTAPKQGREKETRDKDQSPGNHTAQKRQATRR